MQVDALDRSPPMALVTVRPATLRRDCGAFGMHGRGSLAHPCNDRSLHVRDAFRLEPLARVDGKSKPIAAGGRHMMVQRSLDRRNKGREIDVLVNLSVERLDDAVFKGVGPASEVEYIFDRRSDTHIFRRSGIRARRAMPLLKHAGDGVACTSLVVDRFGRHREGNLLQ